MKYSKMGIFGASTLSEMGERRIQRHRTKRSTSVSNQQIPWRYGAMLRQNEELVSVHEYGQLELHKRERADGTGELVREYHDTESGRFVRMVFIKDEEWLVKWFDDGARPLGEVGVFESEEAANDAAKETIQKILSSDDNRVRV